MALLVAVCLVAASLAKPQVAPDLSAINAGLQSATFAAAQAQQAIAGGSGLALATAQLAQLSLVGAIAQAQNALAANQVGAAVLIQQSLALAQQTQATLLAAINQAQLG